MLQTHTHTEHATLIAFPLQQWLHERASLLRHTHSTLPVSVSRYGLKTSRTRGGYDAQNCNLLVALCVCVVQCLAAPFCTDTCTRVQLAACASSGLQLRRCPIGASQRFVDTSEQVLKQTALSFKILVTPFSIATNKQRINC